MSSLADGKTNKTNKTNEEPGEDRCCSAEEIFELCEGSLRPDRERAVRSHLRGCPDCKRRYEREMSLSLALRGSREHGEHGEPHTTGGSRGTGAGAGARAKARSSVAMDRSVAIALPTRSVLSRLVWGVGAAGLLAAAMVSLAVYAVRPVSLATDFMAALWGLTSGISDVAGILLAVSGSTILIALLVGAFVDVLIAATLLAVARWWRPRGA